MLRTTFKMRMITPEDHFGNIVFKSSHCLAGITISLQLYIGLSVDHFLHCAYFSCSILYDVP